MTFPTGAWQIALDAARKGLSANVAYQLARAAGAGVRRQSFLALSRLAATHVARTGEESGRPIQSVPQASEIGRWASKEAQGFGQTTTLVYRERGTGQIKQVFHTTRTDTLVSRIEAMQNAVNAYSGHAEEYDQELIGVTYSSTTQYIPVDLGE